MALPTKFQSNSITTQNWVNKDSYTLGIAALKNRMRSKILLYCSDKLPKRIQFDPKLSKIHPTWIFRWKWCSDFDPGNSEFRCWKFGISRFEIRNFEARNSEFRGPKFQQRILGIFRFIINFLYRNPNFTKKLLILVTEISETQTIFTRVKTIPRARTDHWVRAYRPLRTRVPTIGYIHAFGLARNQSQTKAKPSETKAMSNETKAASIALPIRMQSGPKPKMKPNIDFQRMGRGLQKKAETWLESSIALPTKIKSDSIQPKTEPTRIFTRSASLDLQIEFAPKSFYIAAINSRRESNSIPSSPKSTQHGFSDDGSWIAKKSPMGY